MIDIILRRVRREIQYEFFEDSYKQDLLDELDGLVFELKVNKKMNQSNEEVYLKLLKFIHCIELLNFPLTEVYRIEGHEN